jgi:hypothetical protein
MGVASSLLHHDVQIPEALAGAGASGDVPRSSEI